jgi:hypothetical protein
MRVRHLSDIEIQALLDRRNRAPGSSVSGEIYLKDLEAQEHLDSCPYCLGEIALYRELFSDLGGEDDSYLPRSFARKVTFSLPPFKAQRTRLRLQIAGAWAAALLASLLWYLAKLDWNNLTVKVASFLMPKLGIAKAWVSAAWGAVSLPEISLAFLWTPLGSMLGRIENAFLTEASDVSMLVWSIIALALIGSLDRLYLGSLRQSRR